MERERSDLGVHNLTSPMKNHSVLQFKNHGGVGDPQPHPIPCALGRYPWRWGDQVLLVGGWGWTAALGGLSPRKKVYHRGLGKRKPPTGKGMVFSSGLSGSST